jgi:tetratricopeptide (TPR) repeat protein
VAHENLGNALSGQGKRDEASVAYREAIRLKPDEAGPHYGLGNVRLGQGKLDDALTAYREAIRLKPDHAEAHCNLAMILQRQGDYARALEMYRKGHELGSRRPDWRYPSAQWVAQAERLLAMANLSKRFPAILRGEDKPANNAERLAFAQLAYDGKKFAVATRLWALALASDPKLGDDRQAGHRYNAACAAALAAAGQGKDESPLDDAAKAKLRRQALDWLKAERTVWGKLLESGPPEARPLIVKTLSHWKQDSELAGIRDQEALAKLPADERAAFARLWADVAALLKKAEAKPK